MLTTQPDLTLVLAQRASQLHTPRAIAMKVLKLTQNPQVDASQLTAEIQSDPALTARILRVVNSAMFATRGDIRDLEQAIAMLGVKTLRMLVMGFALPDSLIKSEHTHALAGYWRFAFIKSISAKAIAESIWNEAGEDSFVTGLLHDIGVLVLLQELGKDYAQLVSHAYETGEDLSSLELGLLGFEHTGLGGKLLNQWGLPPSLAIQTEAPFKSDRLATLPDNQRSKSQIIHLADLLARFLLRKDAPTLRALLSAARRYKGVKTGQLEAAIREVQKSEPAMAQAFGQTTTSEDYLAALKSAHRELAHSREAADELFAANGVDGFERLSRLAEQLAENLDELPNAPGNPRQGGEPRVASGRRPVANRSLDNDASSNAVEFADDPLALDMPSTLSRLGDWLSRARRSKTPVSLLLFDVQVDLKDLDSKRELQRDIRRIVACGFESVPAKHMLGANHYVARIERMAAVNIARQALQGVSQLTLADAVTVSVGIASLDLAPPNFPAQDWWAAAERCLYGARCAGGNSIKSIDVV